MPVRFRPFSACRAQYYGTVRGVQGGGRGVARMKKRVAACLAALFACAAAFCAFQLGGTLLEYRAGRREYAVLAQYSPVQAQNGAQAADGETGGQLQADFEALRQIDENVVAWLYGPETPVNYPVVQAADNEYYLTHMFGKKKNSAGAIFVDAGCSPDFSDMHTILYGHHMKNGTMFHDLLDYDDESFYQSHKTFKFDTIYKGGQGTYEIVAVGYSRIYPENSGEFKYYQYAGITSEEDFNEFVDGVKGLSLYDTGVEPEYGDQLVTLSTCTNEDEDGRFFVVGRRTDAKQVTPQ